MTQTIQVRRDTAANFTTANTLLAQGEMGYETDTNRRKIGNGTVAWNSLYYLADNSYTTTATVAGTTVLSVTSTTTQYFTGTTTQTCQLPAVALLYLGQQFIVDNDSTGLITVTSSGANTIATLTTGDRAILTCIALTGTGIASWDLYLAAKRNGDATQAFAAAALTATSLNGVTIDSTTNKPVTAASLNSNTLPASVSTLGVSGQTTYSNSNNAVLRTNTGATTGYVITDYVSSSGGSLDIGLANSAGVFLGNSPAGAYAAVFGTTNTTGVALGTNNLQRLWIDGATGQTNIENGLAVTGTISATTTMRTGDYLVSTLPAGIQGDMAYVHDLVTPAYNTALTGGGTVCRPVSKNATQWVS